MKILLLTHYFAPENSAPQRRWSALIERFTQLGHEVDVLCPPPHYPSGRVAAEHRSEFKPGTSQTVGGARVHRVSYVPHRGDILTRSLDHVVSAIAMVRTATRLRRRGRLSPDVVIATAPAIETLIAGHRIAHSMRVPLVVEMRDAWPDLVTHVPGMSSGKGVAERMKARVHDRVTDWQLGASAVVTTTQRFADVLEGRGVPRPTVVRNGAALERYERLPPRKTGHGELRVLYMGNMGRSQGLDHSIRAAARLRESGVDIDVRFVGYGADKPRLRSINESLGSPVDIRDQVPASEVAQHYEWADTLLVSLRAWQPFEWTVPSKLYEALATGRHITAMIGGEAAEIVAEIDAGDVVQPGDEDALAALWAYLAAAPEALDIGQNGREWVRQHASFDALTSLYLDAISEAIRAGAPRRTTLRIQREAPRAPVLVHPTDELQTLGTEDSVPHQLPIPTRSTM